MSELDRRRLSESLDLAEHAIGLSEPNPRVGCVLADRVGEVVGSGHTQQVGGPHAEVMALRDAQARGAALQGGTAWVSLEPCAHHGRTPPCADALVAAGLTRVVVAIEDPFPQVAGQGIARLRAAGIQVDVADPDSEAAQRALALNVGFFHRIQHGRPWVRLKVAGSLDGRTALDDGRSQWITGPEARADGHLWRRRSGAILTGIGTALDDDPRLDVRCELPTQCPPMRVVVDSSLRLPADARLLRSPGQTLVVHAGLHEGRAKALEHEGASLLHLPGADGQIDLRGLMDALGKLGVNELHVEAGARVNGSLLAAGLVDELLLYVAPMLIGPGRGLAQLAALPGLEAAQRWAFIESQAIGQDLRLRLKRVDRLSSASPT